MWKPWRGRGELGRVQPRHVFDKRGYGAGAGGPGLAKSWFGEEDLAGPAALGQKMETLPERWGILAGVAGGTLRVFSRK